MASMERFEALLGKADDAAREAVLAMASTRGSERGPLYASIAAMWLEMARLEHQIVTAESVTRRVERLMGRVRELERQVGVQADDIPDVFAEPDERDELDYDAAAGV